MLSQLRGALDVIDITERAEALDAMLRTEDDPEERLRIDDRLRSDLELLPASATRYLTYFSSDSEPTTNLGRGH